MALEGPYRSFGVKQCPERCMRTRKALEESQRPRRRAGRCRSSAAGFGNDPQADTLSRPFGHVSGARASNDQRRQWVLDEVWMLTAHAGVLTEHWSAPEGCGRD